MLVVLYDGRTIPLSLDAFFLQLYGPGTPSRRRGLLDAENSSFVWSGRLKASQEIGPCEDHSGNFTCEAAVQLAKCVADLLRVHKRSERLR